MKKSTISEETTRIEETNLRKLVTQNSSISYEENCGNGWLSGEDEPSSRIQTIAKNHDDAELVVFGDGSLGLEIGGKLWMAESPSEERGCMKTMPKGDWQWLNWASGHQVRQGSADSWTNMGDTADLRKL